jgi:hypothetical protein
MNLFFLQNCYKLKTQDLPFLLYLPPTWINSTAIVWEQQWWELTHWCIVEDRIIAQQTRLYYRNCQLWSTVLAQDGLTTEKYISTQHIMNLFFLQNCSKLITQDSPLFLYLPPTKMNIGNKFGRNELQNDKDSQCSIRGRWSCYHINSVRSSSQKLRANPSGYYMVQHENCTDTRLFDLQACHTPYT